MEGDGQEHHANTDHAKWIATNEPLNKHTLGLIGMNQEALQIFVDRFDSAVIASELLELLELLASEKLKRAILINTISGYIKFSEDALGVIPDEDKIIEGLVVKINRYEDEDTSWSSSVYIRQHLVEQIQKLRSFLHDEVKNRLFVTGAPGCGKTSFFWMWAGILMNEKKRVLFIQYRVISDCQIWVLEDAARKRLTSPHLEMTNLKQVVDDLLQTQTKKFDVCICDGVRQIEETCKGLMASLKRWTGTCERHKISKLILVTSLQFVIPESEKVAGNANMMIQKL